MTEQESKIVVIGLGNRVLGDDGIGIRLALDLKNTVESRGVSFQISENGGMELIEILMGFQKALILDGIRTGHGKPGNIYFMNSRDYMETLHISSYHDLDFTTALKMARKLGISIPEKISIIAIEIEEDKIFSESLTPFLKEKYADLLQLVTNALKSELLETVG